MEGVPETGRHGDGRGSASAVCSSGRMNTERFLDESHEKSGIVVVGLNRLAWNIR